MAMSNPVKSFSQFEINRTTCNDFPTGMCFTKRDLLGLEPSSSKNPPMKLASAQW